MSTLIANVVFNSLTHTSMKGIRGTAESQQVIFEAEDLNLHVRVSKPDRERILLGQLFQGQPGTFVCSAPVSLICGSEKIGSTTTNTLGEFRFSGVPAGAVILQAEIPSGPLLIAKFKVTGD